MLQVPKPLMEKRRRDRINQSLETLRMLLLENTHNEVSYFIFRRLLFSVACHYVFIWPKFLSSF